MTYTCVREINRSRCWVCAHIPLYSQGGIPLWSILVNESDTAEWWLERNGSSEVAMLRLPSGFEKLGLALTDDSLPCWKSAGYTLNKYKGWFQPGTTSLLLTSKSIRSTLRGSILNLKTPNRTSGNTIFRTFWTGTQTDCPGTYNGTYFICGHKAYPWLPVAWIGSCYVGYVVPYIYHFHSSPFELLTTGSKRALSAFEQFLAVFTPFYGTVLLTIEVRYLTSLLEKVANDTAFSFKEINAEMVALCTVVLQNQIVLDYLLANKGGGGTCALIGSACCTYISDASENITNLADHIQEADTRLHTANSH
ncbi:endogenous retrovirus group PABLB member 1 Env polyprotein-like [Chiloscyllium punctatum]|uniref:endogenous retrovirus group PABLB member 1 Env polyprotein-like n=1 Tax=Chiloscyllium punctatum TaxID=137246 RepID=UPI003B63B141